MDATPTLLWSTRPCVGDVVPMQGAGATLFAFAVC